MHDIKFTSVTPGNVQPFISLAGEKILYSLSSAYNFGVGMICDDVPIGLAVFGYRGYVGDENEKEAETEAVIRWFFIHPDYREKGYGTELMKYIKDIIHRSGINHIVMEVTEGYMDYAFEEFIYDRCAMTEIVTRREFVHTVRELREESPFKSLKAGDSIKDFSELTGRQFNQVGNYLKETSHRYRKLRRLKEQGKIDQTLSKAYIDRDGNLKGMLVVQSFNKLFVIPHLMMNFGADPRIVLDMMAAVYSTIMDECSDDSLVRLICFKKETELILNKLFPGLECRDIYCIELE